MIIDRFEENFAVCETENDKFVNIDRALLPEGAKVGDVIKKQGEFFIIDEEDTTARRARIQKKQNLLWE